MDPWLRLWYFECWLAEQEKEFETNRVLSILTGSFYNPEAAQKMLKKDSPDISVSEEEAEENAKMLHKQIEQEETAFGKRQRKLKKFKMVK